MRVITSDIFGRWTRGAGLVPRGSGVGHRRSEGIFWSAVLAAGLMGASRDHVLVRSRQVPTLAQVIASAEAEPVVVPVPADTRARAGLRPRGERKP